MQDSAAMAPDQPGHKGSDPVMNSAADLARRTALLDAIGYAAVAVSRGSGGWRRGVDELLLRLGHATGASRVILAETRRVPGRGLCQNILHDWSRAGFDRLSEQPRFRDMRLYGIDPTADEWSHRRERGETVQGLARDLTGRIRELFDQQGCLGFASVPIMVGGQWWGQIGFDDCEIERVWSKPEIELLQAAASLIGASVEREETEAALRDREARLEMILATVADAVVTTDPAGRIESWNAAAARLFGWSSTEAVGQALVERTGLSAPSGRIHVTEELVGIRRDGEPLNVEWTVDELDFGDDNRLLILTIRDLTERHATEERLRQAQRMEAVGQLTGGIAHDFNNLLTVIQGNVQWLNEQLDDRPKLQKLAAAALRAVRRGVELTQRLLAFSRRQVLKPERLDVNAQVQGAIDMLGRTLGERIAFEFRAGPGLPPVMADRTQLENALLNLAVNARDALGGSGTIQFETRRLGPGAGLDREAVAISVADSGVGMAPDVVRRAFEPFFTTKEVGKGSGLGLSMVYGFIKQSGGVVDIESMPGLGTTVRLVLPAVEPVASVELPEMEGERIMGAGEIVLVVEDDADVRSIAVALLNDLGYETLEAETARDALAVLGRGHAIDLVFSDVVLPGGMSGADLAREARQRAPGMPILLASGYTRDELTDGKLPEGGVLLIDKPYDALQLGRAMRNLLRDRAAPELPVENS